MKIIDRYKGFLRRIRLFYILNNIFHVKYLRHNRKLYRMIGLKRPVWMPLRHSVLVKHNPDALLREYHRDRPAKLTDEMLQRWDEEGVVVLKAFFKNLAGPVNEEIDRLLHSGRVSFNFTGNKILFANRVSPVIRSMEKDAELMAILSYLLGRESLPFQTINFIRGSEQKAHSDSIHMATWPEGRLIAAWVALDDVDEGNGPVFYYPGSHKWPYLYNEDIDLNENAWLLDRNPNRKYEMALEQRLLEKPVPKKLFTAEAGDVLIWHANLVHGGSPHSNRDRTRRSMVMHYFGEQVICYHELTQRPAIIK